MKKFDYQIEEMIARLLEREEERLAGVDAVELFGTDELEQMRQAQIQSELDGWEMILEERDDEELFGNWEELCQDEIDRKLEKYRERLDEMTNDELKGEK